VTHLILTRFNCRFDAAWTSVALDPAWLGPRFELFEQYCLPSVLAQDCQNFTWILFFDEETPAPFRQKAQALHSMGAGNIRPIFVRRLTGDIIRQTIGDHINRGASHVITTRLDNDDGLATDFISRLQAAFRPIQGKEYLNVTEGFILCDGRIYRQSDPHNAFVSLVEPTDGKIEGVWTWPHTEIGRHAPVRQIGGGPGWLQIIHGTNVSNKVRGVRVGPKEVGSNFVLDRTSLREKQDLAFWWDRLVMAHARQIRDTAAALVRTSKYLLGKGWKPS